MSEIMETEGAKRDTAMDLASLVKTAPVENESEVAKDAPVEEEHLTPLQKRIREQKEQGTGIVMDSQALKDGADNKPLKNIVYNDQRMDSIKKSVVDLDDKMVKRKAVIVVKNPSNGPEYTEMMMEIDSVKFDENGKAYFDYQNDKGQQLATKYIRLRTEEDPEFNIETDKLILEGADPTKIKEKLEENGNDVKAVISETEDSSEESNDGTDEEISDEKKNIVQVLIDKTGLGVDFMFDDSEKQKLIEAHEIVLKEVEIVDISTLKIKKDPVSFQDVVKAHELSNSRTTVCFPASGFRAQMKGLSYGEMGDISLDMESVTFDQYYKRMSIIYNNMTNISTGPFKDFEDFLNKFAYADIPMALYGLYVATQPEVQQIQLRCGRNDCAKTFDWSFATRSVLRLEKCSDNFLAKMKEITEAAPSDYDRIKEESAVANSKLIKLPESGFVIEMGVISAYDFLYTFIPVLDEKTFKNAFGDDINQTYMQNVLLLTTVRAVHVPDETGEYNKCVGYKDILDALYEIKPDEIKIIAAIANKIQSEFLSSFSFGDVVCPHCKNVTKNLEITMDDLVFQTYQRLLSTEIDVKNIQVL